MSSISTDKKGNRRILFNDACGKRRAVYLGKCSKRSADTVCLRVGLIMSAKLSTGPLDDETARWVAQLDETMTSKLANVGLIPKRDVQVLGDFLDSYIESRTDVKPLTHQRLKEAAAKIVAYFGHDRPLHSINREDANDFRRHLLTKLGDNTVRRLLSRLKQFMQVAVRKGLIRENPLVELKGLSVRPNKSRSHFITHEVTERLIDAAPDCQWRLIIALARYAGLRIPSEMVLLKWSDINWEQGKMLVHSPKTAHHVGGDSRLVPIFPELKPHLEEAWELAEQGAVYVVEKYRDAGQNLRTQFQRIIQRAGLQPWEKLFVNMRASRATELADRFPGHLCAAWLGHSEKIADAHYRQVTDAHFKMAIENPTRNPTQQVSAEARDDEQSPITPDHEPPIFQGFANSREHMHKSIIPPTGFEPVTCGLGNRRSIHLSYEG